MTNATHTEWTPDTIPVTPTNTPNPRVSVGRGFNPDVWRAILSHGSVNLPASRDCTVDVRAGLPSVTLLGYPDSFSMAVVAELRGAGWLLPYRVTVYVPPTLRRGAKRPCTQAIAGYVQSALLNAERVHARNGG